MNWLEIINRNLFFVDGLSLMDTAFPLNGWFDPGLDVDSSELGDEFEYDEH